MSGLGGGLHCPSACCYILAVLETVVKVRDRGRGPAPLLRFEPPDLSVCDICLHELCIISKIL